MLWKIALFLIAITVFSSSKVDAKSNLECQWTQFSVGGSCGQTLDSNWQIKEWQQQANNNCAINNKPLENVDTNTVCCCRAINSQNKPNIKFIIIGSLVAVFGIITVLSFALRKNETS